jgi:hypothetical protein
VLAEGKKTTMKKERATQKIRELNDDFRRTLIGGRVVITSGVNDLDVAAKTRLLAEVRNFSRFDKNNDPLGEHDFGSIDHDGAKFFWKIDYYDLAMHQGSVDPADAEATMRVLTIMHANEY